MIKKSKGEEVKGYLCILLTMITLNAESIKHFVNTGSIYGSVQYDCVSLP
jgi:hypothetical protein